MVRHQLDKVNWASCDSGNWSLVRRIALSSLIKISLRVKKLLAIDKIDSILDWEEVIHVISLIKAVSGMAADNDWSIGPVAVEL